MTHLVTQGLLNITIEVPQKISIYMFSVALAYNGIPFIIFYNIFNCTWCTCIFKGTSSIPKLTKPEYKLK